MAEKIWNWVKTIDLQMKEAQKNSNRKSRKKKPHKGLSYSICEKAKLKRKILHVVRQKDTIIYRVTKIKIPLGYQQKQGKSKDNRMMSMECGKKKKKPANLEFYSSKNTT